MPNLEEQAALLKNQSFLDKVSMALEKVATQIVGEAQDPNKEILHQKRHDLGDEVLNNDKTKTFAKAIISLGSLNLQSPDGDIEWAIGSVWDDIAGVEETDK